MTFKNGKVSFTVEIHEELAAKIGKIADLQKSTFEQCVKNIIAEGCFQSPIGFIGWDEIRSFEKKNTRKAVAV